MLPEEKKAPSKAGEENQQVVVISEMTDFNSNRVLKEIERVDKEIQSVMEGAKVNPERLSFNFTV